MGNSAARIKWPGFRYIKNFNIENRAIKKLEVQETDVQARKLAPRHPSTVKILQELEEKAPKIDELFNNSKVIESSKALKVNTHGPEYFQELAPKDKRPRKENETYYTGETKIDLDYDKYGYATPEKIRAGHLSLRQFDEFLNEYKNTKSAEFINEYAKKHNISATHLHVFLEYYKPFNRLNKPKNSSQKPKELNAESASNVFPNLR